MAALVFVRGLISNHPQMVKKLSDFAGHNSLELQSAKQVHLGFLRITK